MKMDKRGVTALPIKLLIITVLLTISTPMIADAIESNESDICMEFLESESKRISNAATSVYYSMNGAAKMVEVEIPDGYSIVIGGEGNDAYGIHVYCGNNRVSDYWMDKPILRFINVLALYDDCLISVTSVSDGVEVAII